MFRYRKSLDGDSVIPVKDYPIAAAYQATIKPGHVVKLDASGNVIAAVTGDTVVLGVCEGTNFEGIGNTPTVCKVRVSGDAIYEVDHVGGTPVAGAGYGIDGSHNMDVADTTVKVVAVTEIVNSKAYVRITARQLG